MAEPGSPAQPQSMEAILASIKRIIEEPAPAPPAVPAPPEPGPDDDVLELGTPVFPAAPVTETSAAPSDEEDMAPLVSASTREASARAMAALAAISVDPHAANNTLDGLVRELLRPMLKEWLDANLTELVERVVAREVARLGGR